MLVKIKTVIENLNALRAGLAEEHACFYARNYRDMSGKVTLAGFAKLHAGHNVSECGALEAWVTCNGNAAVVDLSIGKTVTFQGVRHALLFDAKSLIERGAVLVAYESSAPELKPWETVEQWAFSDTSDLAKAVRGIYDGRSQAWLSAQFDSETIRRARYLSNGRVANNRNQQKQANKKKYSGPKPGVFFFCSLQQIFSNILLM
jgi:hypothetical protein